MSCSSESYVYDIEKNYKQGFANQKKWAKHWTTYSAHRSHSSTMDMIDPAKKTLDYIQSLEIMDLTYKEKFALLTSFFAEKAQDKYRVEYSYYADCLRYNKKQQSDIDNGRLVEKFRLNRR